MINFILTAAAATAAAAASGPVGWAVLGVVAAIAVGAAVIGLAGKADRQDRALQNMNELLDEADKIKQENGIIDETPTETPKENSKWSILNNGLTGESIAITANDRQEISKGNIIDNYMTEEIWSEPSWAKPNTQTTPQMFDDSLPIGIGTAPPIPNIETKTDEKVNVNTVDWNTLVGEEETPKNEDNTKKEEEDNQPGYIPNPEDKTEENLEEKIPSTVNNEWERWYKLREEQWAREDAIRKETQAREDSAYQRAVADMKKAGLNPNLIGINPAESGGGITQASMPDMSTITNQMNIDLKELQQLIDQNFQGNENDLDRLKDTFTSILSAIAMIVAFKK